MIKMMIIIKIRAKIMEIMKMKVIKVTIMKMKLKVIMRVIVKMIVMVIIRVKIVYINVLMRLVSIRGGSLNSSWTPPSSSRRK